MTIRECAESIVSIFGYPKADTKQGETIASKVEEDVLRMVEHRISVYQDALLDSLATLADSMGEQVDESRPNKYFGSIAYDIADEIRLRKTVNKVTKEPRHKK